MKRFSLFILLLIICMSFAACGEETEVSTEPSATKPSYIIPPEDTVASMDYSEQLSEPETVGEENSSEQDTTDNKNTSVPERATKKNNSSVNSPSKKPSTKPSTTAAKPTETKTTVPSVKPTAPTTDNQTETGPVEGEDAPQIPETVYITASGKKYHYSDSCGGSASSPRALDWALVHGYEPCGKCVLK